MSDSDGDIDDQLLELAGASDKKRRSSRDSPKRASKRSKANISDSDVGPESDEDDAPLYPLEGKYKDAEDMERLMQLHELQREAILAERMEELQRIQDARRIQQMVRESQSQGGEESVSKAAKRQHTMRGGDRVKARKLDELKAKRRAKDDKKQRTSPSHDHRSASPDDMEMSSEDDEDGQFSKNELEHEKYQPKTSKKVSDDEPADLDMLNRCQLTRVKVLQHCMKTWFTEYATGSWVRYSLGTDGSAPVYRMCEVAALVKAKSTYRIEGKLIDQDAELKHGKQRKTFSLSNVSNAPFTQAEYDRLVKSCQADGVRLPTTSSLEKKYADRKKLESQPVTDNDITAQLARKRDLEAQPTNASVTLQRSKLNQERTLACKRSDWKEVNIIDAKLANLPITHRETDANDINEILVAVNERNRRANLEAIRKAEALEAERKRKERKMLATGSSGIAIPKVHDPSARLKITPRTFNPTSVTSRPGTPLMNGATGSPAVKANGGRSVSPLPPSALSGPAKTLVNARQVFEISLVEDLDIDLGDF